MHCWHDLNKDAASGVDGLTAETYALNLEEHIRDLAERVKAGRYRAKLVRRVYIPKENGKSERSASRRWRTNSCNWPVPSC